MKDRLALGSHTLDLAAGELLDAEGRPAALRRQALELLCVLGRRAGEVVSKDELMDAVWGELVVGETSLAQAVADIRRALGDSGHRLLRNVARRGYRLVPDDEAEAAQEVPALSIAVLPLRVDGAGDELAWIADALHGDLVTEVAQLRGALVIARDTVATCGTQPVDPRQVARELRVRHVVRGSLRVDGSSIRLNLALIDGADGMQRWTEAFVVERARLAQGLSALAVQLGRVLHTAVLRSTVAQRAALSPLEVSADDLAMQAVGIWCRGINAGNLRTALPLLERAVALDPDSVRGWGGLTVLTLHAMLNGWLPDDAAVHERIAEAFGHLQRLDSESYFTDQARAIHAFMRRDWGGLLRVSSEAVARSPRPVPFATHGYALILNGRADEAVAALEQALRLSPRDPLLADWQYRLAFAHYMAGRLDLADDWSRTAALANPLLSWPPVHAAAMLELRQPDAAREAWQEHAGRHPHFDAAQVERRLPAGDPRLLEARARLVASLRAAGMP
ncbi:MAG: winged helix-turn-helix domain-containing protein [Rubrivivax sp.]|nr:winged helix-turn-helix domain-containing protein [Rubrivivax sp.]